MFKDTSEGQTHSQNDNCGEAAHNSTPMTNIKQAIQKAVEGGYSIWGGPVKPEEYPILFLDPLFWQCLGKAEGWERTEYHDSKGIEVLKVGRHKCNTECSPRMNYHGVEWEGQIWLYHWHRFIDFLATGKDPDSFFATLSTNTPHE